MPSDPQQPRSQHDASAQRANSSTAATRALSDTGEEIPRVSEAAALEWVGKRLGKYQVTGVIGRGGMGFVLKAHDPEIDRDVAIKMLPERMAGDPQSLDRFRAEARAAGRLSHPNVAAIYEIGQEGRVPYLVLELLTGGGVDDQLERSGVCSPLEATRILIDACQGIAAAHAAGMVHRDLKPANLVMAGDRTVKVTDFGLAKLLARDSEVSDNLTRAGAVLGTPYFMSPEQCRGEEVDARSDIYALGATYYCLLTGRQPFDDSGGVMQVLFAHCSGDVPDPHDIDPSIPSACTQIVGRAMAKDPADRYQSAEEMSADLQAVSAALSGEITIDLPSQSGAWRAADSPRVSASRRVSASSPWWSMRWIGPLVAAALVAMIALGVWGRSGDSPLAPVAPYGEPIHVGVLQSLSGTMAASGTSVVDATLLAIEEINEAGGLLGRPVKPAVADGRSDTQTYLREAERLIVEERVCTVFGCWTSATRKSVRPLFEKHDHLLVYPIQYEGMESSPNIVYLGAAPNQQVIPALLWASESLGKKRFFLVGSDYVFPRAANEIIKDQLESIDAEVVGEMYAPLGSPEFDSIVQAILQSGPDMILNTLNGDSNVAFFRRLRESGIRPHEIPCLSFSVGEQELRSVSITDMEGDYSATTYFQSLDSPANHAFVKRFTERYPQRVVSDAMEAAYVGVHLWAQAVRDAQSIEPKKIRRAMLNQRFAAPEGDIRVDPDTQHCFKTPRVGQVQSDGQFRVVWSAAEPMRPEPYPASRSAEDWKAFLHDLYAGWGDRWALPAEE